MNYQELLARGGPEAGAATRAALIGVGQFGRTLLAQSRHIPALELAVLCDLDAGALVQACRALGFADDQIAVTSSLAAAKRERERGKMVLTDDPDIAIGLDIDVVVEATGDAEAGAVNCLAAIDHGRHVVLVTKETDSIVGPLLSRRARRAGVVVSQVDGDQPSLLLALISWARTLGLELACAGKASEYDFVHDLDAGLVRAEGLGREVRVDGSVWEGGGRSLAELVAHRAEQLSAIPRRTPPDFCEMCLVANGSGLKPDRPELHAAIARPSELPEIYRPQAAGGVLAGEGRLDIFNCFRRPDEISFAGGVFAVLEVPDRDTGELFRAKGIPSSADGRHVLVYNPTHLLGVEAPISILTAHRLAMASGSSTLRPVCDVAMRATDDLAAGTLLRGHGHHHRIAGVEPLLLDHAPIGPSTPLPYFLGLDRPLARAVRRGEMITADAVAPLEDSRLWSLRREQDSERFD